jgi:precorrin-8X/cobalt-precorrin-8 methylmutase
MGMATIITGTTTRTRTRILTRTSTSNAMDWIRDPTEIYRRSFAILRGELDLARLAPEDADIALRVAHASGMVEAADALVFANGPGKAGRAALARGAPILCDAAMVASGILRARLPAKNEIVCRIDAPETIARARDRQTTRAAAAVETWGEALAGSIVAIGNAPTALFRLLEILGEGAPRPAAILAFPVGFVGAAESKAALMESALDIPYATLPGRRGGSAMAAAAVNALMGNPEEGPR